MSLAYLFLRFPFRPVFCFKTWLNAYSRQKIFHPKKISLEPDAGDSARFYRGFLATFYGSFSIPASTGIKKVECKLNSRQDAALLT